VLSVRAQLLWRFVAGRDAAPPRPTLRARTAFRVGFVVVRFIAVVLTLPVVALPVVLFDLRVVAVFTFAAFALAFDGAVFVAVVFPVIREAGRLSTCGDVSTIVSLSADLSVSRSTSPAGARHGLALVFTGCQVCGDPIALCLRNSRAASSWLRRPRCVYVPGFTLFCLLICGT
jgi:hypothetical protein